jgi:Replication-relaxation
MPAQQFPKKRRIAHAAPFRLMARDEAIIEAVHHYRMLERRQVERMFFLTQPGRKTNTNRVRERLRLLFQHGYVERVVRPYYPGQGSAGPVYRLGVSGAKLLAQRTGISIREFRYWGWGDDKDARRTRVHPEYLEHGLALADVRHAVEQSATRHGWQIETWLDDLDLRHDQNWDTVEAAIIGKVQLEKIPILPDSYFVLTTPQGRAHFLLEIDRATESIAATWQRKIAGYKEYVISGQFHRRHGVPWPQTPLRILTVTTSAKRAENLKAAAERYGPIQAAPLFLFSTMGEVASDDVLTVRIWQRATLVGRCGLI